MSLKLEIEQKLGVPVKLKAGLPGSLEIFVNRERIYSKAQSGKMPRNGEILAAIEQRKS